MSNFRFRFILQILAILALMLPGVTASAHQSGGVDLRIWTVNSAGEPVFDICYTLVEYSNLGCDDNLDGNVLFQNIPPGRYYVEPTMHPEGFYWADPFTILVDQYHTDHVVEAYEFRSGSGTGSTTGTSADATPLQSIDVHLITRDPNTGEVIKDACYEFVGYSNIGCDDNQDGHITFADMPYGDYTIRQTSTPAGYNRMGDYQVSIDGGPDGYIGPLMILLAQGAAQAPADLVNISVVLYDPYWGMPVAMEDHCAQFWYGDDPVSLVGCDDDIMDGQIDFMHMEFDISDAGYELDVNAACPYGVIAGSRFQLMWIGEHTASVFVQIDPESGVGCQ